MTVVDTPLAAPEPRAVPCHAFDLHELLGDPFGVDFVLSAGQGFPGGAHPAGVAIRCIGNGIGDPLQVRRHGGPVGDMRGKFLDTRLSKRLLDRNPRGSASRRPGCLDQGRAATRSPSPGYAGIFIGPDRGIFMRLLPHGIIRPTRGRQPPAGARKRDGFS